MNDGILLWKRSSKSASHRLSAFEKHLEVLRTSVLDQALQTTLSHLKHNDSVSVPTKPKSLSRRLTLIFPRVGRLFISIFFHFIYLFFSPPALTRVRCHFQPL